MPPNSGKITIAAALIGGICLLISAVISGYFVLQAAEISGRGKAEATAIVKQSEDTATAVARITPSPLPTYTPYPTSLPPTPYPTSTPYPTYTPVPTSTPIPTPIGEIIPAGQGFKKNQITVTLDKTIVIRGDRFQFDLLIENQTGQQVIVLWNNSFIHVQDDKGKVYRQANESDPNWKRNKQFSVPTGSTVQIVTYCHVCDNSFDEFLGPIEPSTKYLIFRIDQIVGMSNLNWKYEIQQ